MQRHRTRIVKHPERLLDVISEMRALIIEDGVRIEELETRVNDLRVENGSLRRQAGMTKVKYWDSVVKKVTEDPDVIHDVVD